MEFKSHSIDELGRVILPSELRKKQNWGMGDKLSFHLADDNAVILKLLEKYPGPKCVICAKPESKVRVSGSDICGNCLDELKKVQAA